jgi:transcription initiation factor TFIIH subunit 4
MSSSESPSKKSKTATATKRMTTNVLDFLQTGIVRAEILELYNEDTRGRYVCRAVLQRLPETSQQLVVRLSCCGGSFPKASVAIWTKQPIARHLEELYRWAILQDKPNKSDDDGMISLTTEFHKGLKDSLHSLDASPWTHLERQDIVQLEQDAAALGKSQQAPFQSMTPEDLERYTQTQWDAVLHYLVGTPNLKVQPNPAVTHFLLQTDLMQPDPDYRGNPDDAPLVITQKGYDFMLQDSSQQVWHFVVQYLMSIQSHKKAKELKREALLLLICLSFARFGECYSASSLGKDGRTLMKDLALFGLLYVQKIGKTSVFYPTRIAMQLVGDAGSSKGSGGSSGTYSLSSKALDAALAHPTPEDSSHLAIILQTNFQLCAYTTSELHVSMLGLFCDVQSIRRLPNVVIMSITRDSIKAAFTLGIQAQQILRFLEKHSHPRLRINNSASSPLPPNVMDQIFLWDRERHRVQWTEVFMHQCLLKGEFKALLQFSIESGAHAWSSENRSQLFLSHDKADLVQNFVQHWRAKTAARQDD